MSDLKNWLFSEPWEVGIKPNWVNEDGVEWYLDKGLTSKIQKDNLANGNMGIKTMLVYLVRKPNGYKSRVIVDTLIGEAIYDSQEYGAICSKIEALKFIHSTP